MGFAPIFSFTAGMTSTLMRVEALRQALDDLVRSPGLAPHDEAALRKGARLHAAHACARLAGAPFSMDQLIMCIDGRVDADRLAPGVPAAYAYFHALDEVDRRVSARAPLDEKAVGELRAALASPAAPASYRAGPGLARHPDTSAVIYLAPQPDEVPGLLRELLGWLSSPEAKALPAPVRAAVAYSQLAVIRPYDDANGRLARLLATWELRASGYDSRGLAAVEEKLAKDPDAYLKAIGAGASRNYYMGRAEADLTGWIEFFCERLAEAFDEARAKAMIAVSAGAKEGLRVARSLDERQRKVLELFVSAERITAAQIGQLFGLRPRSARDLCQRWVQGGFLIVLDPAKKSRKYGLDPRFTPLLT